jgi:hypothetical protein
MNHRVNHPGKCPGDSSQEKVNRRGIVEYISGIDCQKLVPLGKIPHIVIEVKNISLRKNCPRKIKWDNIGMKRGEG